MIITSKYNKNIILPLQNSKMIIMGYNEFGNNISSEVVLSPTYDKILSDIIKKNGGVNNIYKLYINKIYPLSNSYLLFFKNGSVYVWGYNFEGELGLNNTNDQDKPIENHYIENIIMSNGGTSNIYMVYNGVDYGDNTYFIVFKNLNTYGWGQFIGTYPIEYNTFKDIFEEYGLPLIVEFTPTKILLHT